MKISYQSYSMNDARSTNKQEKTNNKIDCKIRGERKEKKKNEKEKKKQRNRKRGRNKKQ